MLRFAPSPTGDMHIGNLRVAIFNYIVSKQLNEGLIIRIEDTDKARNIEGKDKEILEILNLFSIDYKSVFYQSENLKYHQKMALQLMTQKKAFACFCSDSKLEELKEESIKKGIPFRYYGFCENLSDETVLNTNAPFDVDSFIILRQDKTPTYNYACSVDDMLMDISMVIRGEDHVSNTPKQIHIRESLGYTKEIKYVHLPIILNATTGKKMSKRDDASSVKWLIEQGFLPSAIANYLVLIGNKTPTEIFTLEEAIEWFKIENVSRSGAKFDIDKLRFINRKHIELLDEMRLSKILGFADENIGKLAKLYLEEASTIKEIKAKLNDIFSEKTTLEGFEEESKNIKGALQKAPYFEDYEDLKNYVVENTALKGKNLFKPLRYILTGVENGPNLADIYPFIKNYIGEIVR